MRAITWPLRTRSLKSTSTSVTCPEIWLPTSTVEIAPACRSRRSPRGCRRAPPWRCGTRLSAAAARGRPPRRPAGRRALRGARMGVGAYEEGLELRRTGRCVSGHARAGVARAEVVRTIWNGADRASVDVDLGFPKGSANELDRRSRAAARALSSPPASRSVRPDGARPTGPGPCRRSSWSAR